MDRDIQRKYSLASSLEVMKEWASDQKRSLIQCALYKSYTVLYRAHHSSAGVISMNFTLPLHLALVSLRKEWSEFLHSTLVF